MAKLTKQRWKKLVATVDRVDANAPDEQLHQVRIAARRCRFAAEAAVEVGRPAIRFANRLVAVQAVLGDVQDGVFAATWLRPSAEEHMELNLVSGEYLAAEHAAKASARSCWPKVWVKASRPSARRWFD